MNPLLITNALGSIGFFSSRIFLPALITALLLRFGPHLWLLDQAPLIEHARQTPVWFTSNWSLGILAVLAALEIISRKNADLRRVMHELDVSVKAIMALLTTLGVASVEDDRFVRQTLQPAMHPAGISAAGISAAAIPALLAVIGTVGIGRLRATVLLMLHDIDPDDVLHLQRMLSYAEDAWVIAGVMLLILSPVLMLILIGVLVGLLALARNRLAAREEAKRLPCRNCGEMIYPCASACFRCRTPVAEPHQVGILGQSKPGIDPDVANHPLRLLAKRRCAVCAAHLRSRSPHQTCEVCGTDLTPRFEDYPQFIARRLPSVLATSTALSLVPFVGLVIGTVVYRFSIVNPFMIYLPMGQRFLLKWGIRVLFVVLAFVQIVPLVGVVVVPLMAVISFAAYRQAFVRRNAISLSPAIPAPA